MAIHVVQQGDTLYSIAQQYQISVNQLRQINEINRGRNLVVGEALVILYPEQTYTVQKGDTLEKIANQFGTSPMELLRNNPYLSDREFLVQDEIIVISYSETKIAKIATTGYAYPFIDELTLKKTLPFLTYLNLYSYKITSDGEIISTDDNGIIKLAKSYGVAPILILTAVGNNQNEILENYHKFFSNVDNQERFMNNLFQILKEKGFYGANITTPYIYPDHRDQYVTFMEELGKRMNIQHYKFFNTFILGSFEIMTNTIYQGIDYQKLGEIFDVTMVFPYEQGYTVEIPVDFIGYDKLIDFINYMSTYIPMEKMFLGFSTIGYLWQLPYEACISKGIVLNYNAAIELASDMDATILFDDTSKISHFQYFTDKEYIVRFKDARSIVAISNIISQFSFQGAYIWNIMYYFPQLWMIINSKFEIEKVEIQTS